MRSLLVVFLLSLATGCSHSSPYLQKIKAETSITFALWRSKVGDSFSAREWALFDRALQEIKYKIMEKREATGSSAIDQAMREKIDGKITYDVMKSGLQTRLDRFLTEKSELEKAIVINSRLRTKPGDDASADVLATARNYQSDRLAKVVDEITEAKSDINLIEAASR